MENKLIIQSLIEKNKLKKEIHDNALKVFGLLKKQLQTVTKELSMQAEIAGDISYKENGAYEAQVRFGGEILIFSLHTDVFNFDDSHFTHKLKYVKEDTSRSYCSIIKIYNFLADSFTYNRFYDLGYLIGRVFINRENHFFVEGKRQLGFLYNDFENCTLEEPAIRSVIESCILYAIEFDLLVPPYNEVKEITVSQKQEQQGNAAIKTGKRLGFLFQADNDTSE